MKIKLSAYWWCQIAGWSAYTLIPLIEYVTYPGYSFRGTFFPVLLEAILNVWITHLMRLFIIKNRILDQDIFRQVIYLLLINPVFSLISVVLYFFLSRALFSNWDKNFIVYGRDFRLDSLVAQVYPNIFFGIWNLIYFSYHLVKKSQQEQIERIHLESELKIQQLEIDKSRLEFERNLANTSLTALRSQMNPHFIFNCLNSIKLYTAQNNTEAASEYLTKFSRLIRLVMDNSAKEKITLSEELNVLFLYIEMESMRFKEKLHYNVVVHKNVEADYIELPPMLLQPYIENAIWHGLMHKEEGGTIDVNITIDEENSLLSVTITDNGIGRVKSAEIKSKNALNHKSYGMQLTSERIALINQSYSTGAEIKIEDLVDDDKNAVGTKVTVLIPV